MTRIIHIGDQHVGGEYAEKADRAFDFLSEQINDSHSPAYNPDVICSTGDLTHKGIHVHSEHLKSFLRFVSATHCDIIMLQGTNSHEPAGTLQNIASLSSRIKVIDNPCTIYSGKNIRIAGLPALSRPLVAKWCSELYPGESIDWFGNPDTAVRMILQRTHDLWQDFDGTRILLGHWTVEGSKTSTGHMLPGSDISVGVSDIALAGAHATLVGHIHFAQVIAEEPFISYCGSSHPVNWGETDPKSFSVYEFGDNGEMLHFERIPYPSRPMIKIVLEFQGTQTDGAWDFSSTEETLLSEDDRAQLTSSEVKVCYSIPREISAQVDDMYVRLLFQQRGIELAVVERTIQAEGHERIPDIADRTTVRQMYEATCEAQGTEPRPGAIEKADQLEEEGVAS